MKRKDQVLLEQAYQSVHEGGMPPTTGGADFEMELTKAKIIFAKITDDLEELQYELQKLYGGKSLDLDPKIEAIFDRIDARIETIVPTEDY
jgi:hypothetical protein